MVNDVGFVSEIEGLYGPISVSELVIQKIWLRGEFRRNGLKTLCGKSIEVVYAGTWNRLGGPDFLKAELIIGGKRVVGDVEVHFYLRDWLAHGHDENRAFDEVSLHVVVFDPQGGEKEIKRINGQVIPTLVLLPHLFEGIEEYALADALRCLTQRDPYDLAEGCLSMSQVDRREAFIERAGKRWAVKCNHARRLLAGSGWETACHLSVLGVLGYRRNRGTMVELGDTFPVSHWMADTEATLTRALEVFGEKWQLGGIRPANAPELRLRQYGALFEHNVHWMARLAGCLESIDFKGAGKESTRAYRKRSHLGQWRSWIRDEILGKAIPVPRMDTVMIDAVLPLLAVSNPDTDLFPLWYHWNGGDLPAGLRRLLSVLELVNAENPLSNGLQQGALQRLIEERQTVQVLD